jgi:hypothetical protein
MAQRDFSHAWVVCNDSKTSRKREGRQGCAATELLMKKHQNVIFDIMSEVQKYLQDVSAGIG